MISKMKLIPAIVLFLAFAALFTTIAFAETTTTGDTVCIAQSPSGGSPPKGNEKFANSDAAKKMRAAVAKYSNDPVFQQLLEEEQKYRESSKSAREKTMNEQKAKINKIQSDYRAKMDKAKTETEKNELKKEMQSKIALMVKDYKKQADAKRKQMQARNVALEKKYGAKFPDYFAAKNALIKEMQSNFNNRNKQGNKQGNNQGNKQGGFGSGQGSNDPQRQKMFSIMQKYKDDPDFQKLMEETGKARDEMRTQMETAGENRSEKMRIMQNFRAKMDELEKKYGAKFPDYFEALKEMRRNRGNRGPGGGGPGGGGPGR